MTDLKSIQQEHLATITGWLPDKDMCRRWAGEGLRFPMTPETLYNDLGLSQRTTRVLLDDAGALLAFGQYYNRLGRAHLARIIIRPDSRGRGVGRRFIELLMTEAVRSLNAKELSIFVDNQNRSVLPLYERLGFVEHPYPDSAPALASSLYMIAAYTSP